jgi:hypothetical protein
LITPSLFEPSITPADHLSGPAVILIFNIHEFTRDFKPFLPAPHFSINYTKPLEKPAGSGQFCRLAAASEGRRSRRIWTAFRRAGKLDALPACWYLTKETISVFFWWEAALDMQIEKNIAAMLQSKMKETGKTKLEFSEFEMSEFQIHGGGEQQ